MDFELNFINSDIVIGTSDGIFVVDDKNNITQISVDEGYSLCVVNDKIYYDRYFRINIDGSDWEKISSNDFVWIGM